MASLSRNAGVLARRPDEAGVIGVAQAARLGGGISLDRRGCWGFRRTMRGWLRRFAELAGRVRETFRRVQAALSADPVSLAPAGG